MMKGETRRQQRGDEAVCVRMCACVCVCVRVVFLGADCITAPLFVCPAPRGNAEKRLTLALKAEETGHYGAPNDDFYCLCTWKSAVKVTSN